MKGIESLNNKDYSTALGYFMDAVDAGNSHGITQIVDLYMVGFFTDADKARLLEHFDPDVPDASAASLVFMGDRYLNGLDVEKDFDTALQYFQKAADMGYPVAYNEIGYTYHQKAKDTGYTG